MTSTNQHDGVPLDTIVERMREIGMWSEKFNRPLFGWLPILYGWRIGVQRNGDKTTITINGVPWAPHIPTPGSTHDCPYRAAWARINASAFRSAKHRGPSASADPTHDA